MLLHCLVTRQAVNTEAFGRGVGSAYDREREAAYRLRKQVRGSCLPACKQSWVWLLRLCRHNVKTTQSVQLRIAYHLASLLCPVLVSVKSVTPLSTLPALHLPLARSHFCALLLAGQVDEMEGLGSALKLPASVIQEAGHLLREVSCWAVGEVS